MGGIQKKKVRLSLADVSGVSYISTHGNSAGLLASEARYT